MRIWLRSYGTHCGYLNMSFGACIAKEEDDDLADYSATSPDADPTPPLIPTPPMMPPPPHLLPPHCTSTDDQEAAQEPTDDKPADQ